MEELRNAFGALRVPIDDASLNALFNDLDADQSGTLDFDELHKALRKEPPRRVPADQICLTLPRRKEPNVLGTGAERRALAALKRAVHVHLDRTTDLFHQMDYDGDGLISKQELKRALAAQCIEVDRVALDSLFAKLDADNSGGVDFKEMHRMLRREFTFVDELADARLVNGPASGGGDGPFPFAGSGRGRWRRARHFGIRAGASRRRRAARTDGSRRRRAFGRRALSSAWCHRTLSDARQCAGALALATRSLRAEAATARPLDRQRDLHGAGSPGSDASPARGGGRESGGATRHAALEDGAALGAVSKAGELS